MKKMIQSLSSFVHSVIHWSDLDICRICRIQLVAFVGLVVFVGFVGFILPSPAEAVDCSRSPGGNVTISSSCTFSATVDGADAGSGSSNTADITVSGGATLTIGAGQTLSTGTLTPSGGSIAIISGGQIKIGSPLWMYDADGDGYPKESTMAAQATADPGFRRRNLMTSLTQRDCRDFYNSGYDCAPSSSDLSGGTHNRTFEESSGNIAGAYHELPADINTVGLWHMNEASGNVADSSGNSNTGTPTGTTVVAGKFGNASDFDGSTSKINVGTGLNVTNNVSFEAWIYLKGLPGNGSVNTIIGKYGPSSGSYYFYVGTDYKLAMYFYGLSPDAGTISNSTIPLNTWTHVASTYDGSTVKLYINGVLDKSQSETGVPTQTSTPVHIGHLAQTAFYWWFKGTIDEVRISNIARTPEEIKADAQRRPYGVYTAPVNDLGQTPGSWSGMTVKGKGIRTGDGETPHSTNSLVAQWNFNETSGTAAVSGGSCGTSCNGTLTGFASTSSQDQAAGTGWTVNNKRWGAGAIMTDGSNDYILCTDANCGGTDKLDLGSSAFAVEAWIKTNHDSGVGVIISKGTTNDFSWQLDVDRTEDKATFMFFQTGSGADYMSAVSKTSVNDGLWHHIVGTWNPTGTTMKIYVDGNLEATSTSGSGTQNTNTAAEIRIGGRAAGDQYLSGVIDAVRAYKRELGAAEILANYQAGNIEFQTRTGTSQVPDGTWEAWKPTTNETQLLSMDSDSANWLWDMRRNAANTAWEEGATATYMPKSKADDSTTKMEGSGALRLAVGAPQVDANTVGLWHMEETSGTGAYIKDSTISPVSTGTGADGACTVSSGTTNINTASCAGRATADAVNFSVTANTASAQNQITVSSTPTGLSVNDEVLIINLQGSSAGQYEMKTITAITTNTLTLNANLSNSYDGTTQKIMVQRVPNYTSVSVSSGAILTVSGFSCSTYRSGALFFRANGTATVNGTIEGNSLGFAGHGNTDQAGGHQGGSYTSCDGSLSTGANNGGGGGGRANAWNVVPDNGGGGGGGGYGVGGTGGNNSSGGNAGGTGGVVYGNSLLSTLFSGSGGGGGGNEANGPAGEGGNGGGIIAIWASTLTVNTGATIRSNGAAGGCGNNTSGGGGGGSGGSILIQASTTTLGTNLITATGGSGGPVAPGGCGGAGGGGNGGGGGAGRIAITSTSSVSGSTNPSANVSTPNHGTPTGTGVVDGFYGKGKSFNGTSDYVAVGALSGGSAVKSVEFWVYPNSTSTEFVDLNGSAYINASSGTVAATGFTSPTIYVNGVVSSTIVANQWQYIAVTTGTGINASATNIGKRSTSYLNGKIDEVRISNTARTAEEIAEAYRAGRDNRLSKTITSSDLSLKSKVPFWVASDRPGTFMEATVGESAYANYEPDANTVGLWHLEESAGSGAYIKNSAPGTTPTFVATGGTITYSGGYTIHTFTSSGTFTPNGTGNVEVLVVAGGGGGGQELGGGGGGGGVVYNSSFETTGATTVTVGPGATAINNNGRANNGSNSVFGSITAYGGGGGGGATTGGDGGTGGGGGVRNSSPYAGGSGSQGYSGGPANNGTWPGLGAGGGGGGGGAGSNGYSNKGGNGGIGYTSSISGSSVNYAGGGGGGSGDGQTPGDGINGGGNGSATGSTAGASGTANTGGGGGGGGGGASAWTASAGGSGIVRVRYPTSQTYPVYNHGTPTGTTNVAGKIGKARSFNGTSDYIDLGSYAIPTAYTISSWIKLTSTSGTQALIGSGDTVSTNTVMIYGNVGDGKIHVSNFNVELLSNTVLSAGQWYYVTVTNNGTTATIYINGSSDNSGSVPHTSISQTTNIGRRTSNQQYFNGTIDEVKIDNVVRTADEIRQAFEYGRRTHPVTIDFVTSPQAAYSSGTSVTINNPYGTTALTNTLSVGDTIIFKENVNGTETVGQAVVSTIANTSTSYGTVTVAAAPTFPSGGYSTNAKVFKWQREYFDPSASLGTHRDATTRLTFRVTDGSQGANVWLDDLKSNTNYINRTTCDTLNTTTGECTYTIPSASVTSSLNRYFQMRAIMSTWDTAVSPILTSSQIEFGL